MKMSHSPIACVINLQRLKSEEGSFPCPGCGALISPDDLSDKTYRIYQVEMEDDLIKEVVIHCNLCGIEIHLTGFELYE